VLLPVQKCKSAKVQTALKMQPKRQAFATSLSYSNAKVHDDNRHTSMGYSKIQDGTQILGSGSKIPTEKL
jgi:hypothetical protein